MCWLHRILCCASLGGMAIVSASCNHTDPEYGREATKRLASTRPQVWAVAPVVNLSGERGVDPILQADLVFQQLQQVKGLTVLPVNRIAEVYAALRIDRITSPQQAALLCDVLQCDALLVTAVTIYDPYNPPKLGAAMQLFIKPQGYARPAGDPREIAHQLARSGEPVAVEIIQAVDMLDAANGTVRDRLDAYVRGRHDPLGPLGAREYLVSIDRYCGFGYSELIDRLLLKMASRRAAASDVDPGRREGAVAARDVRRPEIPARVKDFIGRKVM